MKLGQKAVPEGFTTAFPQRLRRRAALAIAHPEPVVMLHDDLKFVMGQRRLACPYSLAKGDHPGGFHPEDLLLIEHPTGDEKVFPELCEPAMPVGQVAEVPTHAGFLEDLTGKTP